MVRDASTNLYALPHCGTRDFAADFKVNAWSHLYAGLAPSTSLPRKRAFIYVELMSREEFVEMWPKPIKLPASGLSEVSGLFLIEKYELEQLDKN